LGGRDLLRHAADALLGGVPDTLRNRIFEQRLDRWLKGNPGEEIEVEALDGAGLPRTVRLVRTEDQREKVSVLNLPPLSPQCRVRSLEGGIGYIGFNLFLMQILPRIKEVIRSFRDAPGLILDLRGNPGGIGLMAVPIAAVFFKAEGLLGTMHQREGEIRFAVLPEPPPVDVPLVVLVDERSGSTAEILAAGLQEAGRALVLGTQTAGAVLPSIMKILPTGARLQYPVADFITPKGRALEGQGVIPDIEIPLSRAALARGQDNVIQAALAIIKAAPR
jgi:carboxyl-terminal processing protease